MTRSIFFFLFLWSNVVTGQKSYSIETGIGLSHALMGTGSDKVLTSRALQYHIISGVDLPIKKTILSLGIGYSKEGYRYVIHNYLDQGKVTARMAIHYAHLRALLNIPVLFSKKRKRNQKKWHAIIGLFTSRRVNSNWKYNDEIDINANEIVLPWNSGGIIGFSRTKRTAKNRSIGLAVYYTHGFTNILDHPFNKAYLRHFACTMDYRFYSSKKKKKNHS